MDVTQAKNIVLALFFSTLLLSPVNATVQRTLKSASNAVQNMCSTTLYPELCFSSLGNIPSLDSRAKPMEILRAAVSVGTVAVKRASAHTGKGLVSAGLTPQQKLALHDCQELFDDTLAELNTTLTDLDNMTFFSVPNHAPRLETLLSAAITNQDTCFDGIALSKGNLTYTLQGGLDKVKRLVSNSLAMLKNISGEASGMGAGGGGIRRLLSDHDGFPSWMTAGDRRLLQAPAGRFGVHAVVAKDGSGHYSTVSAAVNAAPQKSKGRYVIYVKRGVYRENVEIRKNKINLMLIGDGKGVTIVTGSRNVRDGSTTFHSATLAVTGNKFMARDITFENTAGPAKHQAAALRVGSDLSVFYRCSIKGYQDTLYVHSLRQFYRECDVCGTVDFIFGNAAVVLQKYFALSTLYYGEYHVITGSAEARRGHE